MLQFISGTIVALFGFFLIGLAALCVVRRSAAERFLSGFANSAKAHFTEHTIRLAAGLGFVLHSSEMSHPLAFRIFGWVLVATSVVLLVLPWKWHREYARRTMPLVLKRIRLFAVGAFALGVFVLYGLSQAVL